MGLLERERELAALNDALARARRGTGSLLVVSGQAGRGKSALLHAAVRAAHRRRLTPLTARSSELEQELAFGIVRQLLGPLVQSLSAPARRRLLSGVAALARPVLSAPTLPLAGAGAGDGGFAALHGLHWLIHDLAAERPLLLAVDDVHWADAPSLRALHYLAGRIGELPVALVVTLRSHEPTAAAELADALESHPAARRLEAKPLSPGAVATIVRTVHPNAEDEVCAAFCQAGGGNPFYVRELLRSLSSSEAPPAPAAVRGAALTSVGDHVRRRLSALGAGAVELAGAMAVLGAGGRLHHAASIARQDTRSAAVTALAMRRIEILAAEEPFEWVHPLVRRSVYDSLTVTRRDELHARAAEVLTAAGEPPEAVAPHLAAITPAGSTAVVTGLLCAADQALARDAPDVAVTLVHRALDERAPEPSRVAVLLKLGRIEVTRRSPAARAPLHEVRRLSADPRERALAALGLGESYLFTGDWDASGAIVQEALSEGGAIDEELALELQLAHALGCAYDPDRAHEFWRDEPRLISLAHGRSWPARALAAGLALASTLRGTRLAEAVALCRHAMAGDVLLSQRGAGSFSSAHVASTLIHVDAGDEALAFIERLEHAARSQGSFANVLASDACRGLVLLRRGDLLQAEEILRSVFDLAAQLGVLLITVNMLYYLPDLIAERPAQAALADQVEALALPPAFARAAGGVWMLSSRGRLRALRGARAAAEEDLRASAAMCRQLRWGPIPEPWRSTLALVLEPQDRDEARALVDEELRLAVASGLPRPHGVVLRAAGLLAGGDAGVEMLRESVAVLAEAPARYEHARSLIEWGAALRRTGRRSDAREPLSEGMELAAVCGAERLIARAREELLSAGARPRRIARSGFSALTASERRVIRMAAEGRSNADIAQALFVSLKTVETHLSHAYAKLDLSGRGARQRLPTLLSSTA